MKFGGSLKKCPLCNKTAYLTESVSIEGELYHKTCLRCSHCKKVLSLGNFAAMGGVFYCKPHFKQLFKSKGNYDEGFGKEQHKKKWVGGEGQTTAGNSSSSKSDRTDEKTKGGVKDKLSRFKSAHSSGPANKEPVKTKVDEKADVRVDDKASASVKDKLSRFSNLSKNSSDAEKTSKPVDLPKKTRGKRSDTASAMDVKGKMSVFEGGSTNDAPTSHKPDIKLNTSVKAKKNIFTSASSNSDAPKKSFKLDIDDNARTDASSKLDVKAKLSKFEQMSPRDAPSKPLSHSSSSRGDVKAKLDKFKNIANNNNNNNNNNNSAAPSSSSSSVRRVVSARGKKLAKLSQIHAEQNETGTLQTYARDLQVGRDVYGKGTGLQAFEADVAKHFGCAKARFFVSGIMAQNAALMVAADGRTGDERVVGLHPRSHLVLHEEDAYKHVCQLDLLSLGDSERALTADDVVQACDDGTKPAVIVVELPQRENGGVLPKLADVKAISKYCRDNNIHLHMDGARLWQCAGAYGKTTLTQLCALFDSVYVSFYKDLGSACAGAMLMGDQSFIDQACVWQRRFGGNLYTMFPLANAAAIAFKSKGKSARFDNLRVHAKAVAAAIGETSAAKDGFVRIEPSLPNTNMMHLHLPADVDVDKLMQARDVVKHSAHIEVFTRVRKNTIEYTIGSYNEGIAAKRFAEGWEALYAEYSGKSTESNDEKSTRKAAMSDVGSSMRSVGQPENDDDDDSAPLSARGTRVQKDAEASAAAAAQDEADRVAAQKAKRMQQEKEEREREARDRKARKEREKAKKAKESNSNADDEKAQKAKKEEEEEEKKKKEEEEEKKKEEEEEEEKKKRAEEEKKEQEDKKEQEEEEEEEKKEEQKQEEEKKEKPKAEEEEEEEKNEEENNPNLPTQAEIDAASPTTQRRLQRERRRELRRLEAERLEAEIEQARLERKKAREERLKGRK